MHSAAELMTQLISQLVGVPMRAERASEKLINISRTQVYATDALQSRDDSVVPSKVN